MEVKLSEPQSVHRVRYSHGVHLSPRPPEADQQHADGKRQPWRHPSEAGNKQDGREMRMNPSGLHCMHTTRDDYVLLLTKCPKWDQLEEKQAIITS